MSKLERVAYLCLIGVSLLSATVLVKNTFFIKRQGPPVLNAAMLVGKKVAIPGATWNTAPLNAVVFISTECHFCDESMPFYRQLITERNSSKSPVTLSAASVESTAAVKQHLAAQHVDFDHVYQISGLDGLLRVTPTFLLLNRDGVIVQAVIGELNTSKQKDMLLAVKDGTLRAVIDRNQSVF